MTQKSDSKRFSNKESGRVSFKQEARRDLFEEQSGHSNFEKEARRNLFEKETGCKSECTRGRHKKKEIS